MRGASGKRGERARLEKALESCLKAQDRLQKRLADLKKRQETPENTQARKGEP
jgi:hypothetical protein